MVALLLQVDIFCRTGVLHKLLVELLKCTPGKWGALGLGLGSLGATRSLNSVSSNFGTPGQLGSVLWAVISQRRKEQLRKGQ